MEQICVSKADQHPRRPVSCPSQPSIMDRRGPSGCAGALGGTQHRPRPPGSSRGRANAPIVQGLEPSARCCGCRTGYRWPVRRRQAACSTSRPPLVVHGASGSGHNQGAFRLTRIRSASPRQAGRRGRLWASARPRRPRGLRRRALGGRPRPPIEKWRPSRRRGPWRGMRTKPYRAWIGMCSIGARPSPDCLPEPASSSYGSSLYA
jgi:hypothetical protein